MLQRWKKRRIDREKTEDARLRRAGITLVETMVSVLLLMILMAMVVGIVSPAFRTFVRMQKLQFAQMILDNVVEDVQDTVREATTYVKIYDESVPGDGVASGKTLEYLNTDGYVTLVSTGGCNTTYLYHSNTIDSVFDSVDPGQLLFRYYRKVESTSGSSSSTAENTYYYYTRRDSVDYPIARAATTAFGSGYYMGNYLEITFYYPDDVDNEDSVSRLKATASLYDKPKDSSGNYDPEDLVVSEEFIIDFRYEVKRSDAATASYDAGTEPVMQWSDSVQISSD